MADIKIERELSATKGRYLARVEGIDGEAELTISRAGDKLVIADHTFAPDTMRGTGVAKAMADRLIADARAEGFKVMPLCPYVKSQFLKNPDLADVLYQ